MKYIVALTIVGLLVFGIVVGFEPLVKYSAMALVGGLFLFGAIAAFVLLGYSGCLALLTTAGIFYLLRILLAFVGIPPTLDGLNKAIHVATSSSHILEWFGELLFLLIIVVIAVPLVAIPFALMVFYKWLLEDILGINCPGRLGEPFTEYDYLSTPRMPGSSPRNSWDP